MTRAGRGLLVALVASAAASPTYAQQRAGRLAACRVDSSAAWFTRQRRWFDDSKHAWTNDTLRTALLRAAGMDPGAPVAVQWGWVIAGDAQPAGAGDSAMTAALRTLTRTRAAAWPTKSVVGAAGAHAVALLALRDTALGRAALHRLMEAGPEESPAADVATLEDRLRLLSGRKQLYGTQFQRTATGLTLAPMEDSAHVDLRREDAGLPPFTLSACLARSATPRP